MIYNNLSNYYDDLVKDEQATLQWVKFVKKHTDKKKILELACGSGEITNKLILEGFDVLATDLSENMLEKLNEKYPNINTRLMDMASFNINEKFDTVICFCDSINYLQTLDEIKNMFISSYNALNENGKLLFDMHTEYRLEEFSEEFLEEGFIDNIPYQWSIISEDDLIYHHFAFYTKDVILEEYHVQKVYDLDIILNLLKEIGYKYKVYTDFNIEGKYEGEKYFIVGEKI